MLMIMQLLTYGLQLGSVYALLALGYTMVYGLIGLINFAHGDFLMVASYIVYFAAMALTAGGFSMDSILITVLVILLATVITGFLGVGIERIAYKPLRNKPRLTALITAIGVSIFLENFPRVIPAIGPVTRSFPTIFPYHQYNFGGVGITSIQILTFVVSVVLMIVLQLFISRTLPGKQMRAVSVDKDASSLMGISVNRTISITFFIGASLAAISGIFYSATYPIIDLTMGSWLGTKAFIAAVLGGIGDIRGAMLGGFLMGVAEMFATQINSEFGGGVAFIILILVLLVKPTGIMGKTVVEKV